MNPRGLKRPNKDGQKPTHLAKKNQKKQFKKPSGRARTSSNSKQPRTQTGPHPNNLNLSIYQWAAQIVRKCLDRQGTPKSLILSGGAFTSWTEGRRKRLFAVVSETLKYASSVLEVIQASSLLEQQVQLPPDLALVLVHELLFGKEPREAVKGRYGAMVAAHKTRLLAELAKLKVRKKVTSNTDLASSGTLQRNEANAEGAGAADLPRYIRVNTIRTTLNTVLNTFHLEGYTPGFLDPLVQPFPPLTICPDDHIPDLLSLPPKTPLHTHPLLQSGQIIIQDKASCFPAFALNPPPGAHVIDCCAAPGNKTTQLAALMENKGSIIAVERDARRAEILRTMVHKAGASIVKIRKADFLTLDPTTSKDLAKVTHILLDPSCSGSGIVDRHDYFDDTNDSTAAGDADRLTKLAEFQTSAVQHAMNFPSATKLVYSTCSIHNIENEEVVLKALEMSKQRGLGWKLVQALPSWHRRGVEIAGLPKEEADKLVRAVPKLDGTIGFFVALFERDL